MSSVDKHLILICYDFPPNSGIGGRRWAKLARQLSTEGFVVHVIKAKPINGRSDSPWIQDVEANKNIITYELDRKYPSIVSFPRRGILNKIKYRLEVNKLRKHHAGTIYDLAVNWEKQLEEKALAIIHENEVKNIIVTGAPFNLMYYATKVKEKVNVNVVCDYRDPWITATNYGMPGLNDSQMLFERQKQEYIFKNADVVVCPNEFMLTELMETAIDKNNLKARFEALPHFFDEKEIEVFFNQTTPERSDNRIRIVYGGAIYMGLGEHLKRLNILLNQLKKNNFALYQKLDIRFFTPDVDKVGLEAHPEIVSVAPSIGREIFTEVKQADHVLIMLAEHNKQYKTTKFFEYMPFKKPYLYLGPEGEVARSIREEKLGQVIADKESLEELLENSDIIDYPFEQHSLKCVTERLQDFLV